MATFDFGSREGYKLTSTDVAKIVYNDLHATKGFVCSRMSYMSKFKNATYKFETKHELIAQLDNYCNLHDTNGFDYNEVHIVFVTDIIELEKFTVVVHRTMEHDNTNNRKIEINHSRGKAREASAIKKMFTGMDHISGAEDKTVFLCQ